MKTLIALLVILLSVQVSKAQIDVLGKIQEKVEQKVDQKTDEAIEKALEDEKKKEAENAKKEDATTTTANTPAIETSFKSYSKFDFVPGENVIFYDDFAQDAIGDFPPNWNTTGTGEVVTAGTFEGRWLKWSAGVSYAPNLSITFPDNFTFEFDMLMQKPEGREDPYFGFEIYSDEKDALNEQFDGGGRAGTAVTTQRAWDASNWLNGEMQNIGTSQQINNSDLYNHKTHVAVWGQKQRMRIYVNETKVFDLPKAFPLGAKLNRIKFSNNPGLNLSNDQAGPIFISNVRIAVGAPDMRSKLMSEGKLVTRGILFDVNSDKIRSESYGTLKEIAAVLKENGSVRVKIIGHTDSDGDNAKNMELSKKRAASVKNSLSTEFGIDASRLDTDGKGESQPVSPNTSAEGKANNRRVEFVKL
ncbi:MAG: OmpA family protein [bacterium]